MSSKHPNQDHPHAAATDSYRSSSSGRATGAKVQPTDACRCDPEWCSGEVTPEEMTEPSKWCRWCGVHRDPQGPRPAAEPEAYPAFGVDVHGEGVQCA